MKREFKGLDYTLRSSSFLTLYKTPCLALFQADRIPILGITQRVVLIAEYDTVCDMQLLPLRYIISQSQSKRNCILFL